MNIYIPTEEFRKPKQNEFYRLNRLVTGIIKATFEPLNEDREIYQEVEIDKKIYTEIKKIISSLTEPTNNFQNLKKLIKNFQKGIKFLLKD